MVRVRSIQETYQMLKADDPESHVTTSMLRRWVADGTLPCIRVGRKILLNFDTVLAFLSTPNADLAEKTSEPGVIRPISATVK